MEYLEKHGLHVYLADALARLSEDKPSNAAANLLEYFDAVLNGTNVLLREFSYIQATPRNRLSFASQLGLLLHANPEDSFKPADYYHLVELISARANNDRDGIAFPFEIVKRAADVAEYILGLREPRGLSEPGILLPKKSFIVFFRVCLYYLEFMESSENAIQRAFAEFSVATSEVSGSQVVSYSATDLQEIRRHFVAHFQTDLEKLGPDRQLRAE